MEIELLLRQACARKASDLHLTAGLPPVFREAGALVQMPVDPLTPLALDDLVRQILTEEQYQLFRNRGEVDCPYAIPGVSRFRVNAYWQRGSAALAIRVIPQEIPSMEALGLPPVVASLLEKPQGLLVVTGPTGSGKTTSLAAMVDHLNRTRRLHILTLEYPIEYLHHHQMSMVNQREVGVDTASFAQGLRAALREDPDVILVGEMRDVETMATALSAAETGHLVLTTLHTPDAPQTVDRLIDSFPPQQQRQIRLQVASVLLGVIAQRLFQRADGQGRVAAFEILVNTPAVANLIRSEKVHQIRSVMETGRSQGMQTMQQSLRELAQQGLLTPDIVKTCAPVAPLGGL